MRLPLSLLLTPLTMRNLFMTRLTLTAAVLMTAAVTTFAIPFVHPTKGAGPAAAFQAKGQQEPDSKARKAMLSAGMNSIYYREPGIAFLRK